MLQLGKLLNAGLKAQKQQSTFWVATFLPHCWSWPCEAHGHFHSKQWHPPVLCCPQEQQNTDAFGGETEGHGTSGLQTDSCWSELSPRPAKVPLFYHWGNWLCKATCMIHAWFAICSETNRRYSWLSWHWKHEWTQHVLHQYRRLIDIYGYTLEALYNKVRLTRRNLYHNSMFTISFMIGIVAYIFAIPRFYYRKVLQWQYNILGISALL